MHKAIIIVYNIDVRKNKTTKIQDNSSIMCRERMTDISVIEKESNDIILNHFFKVSIFSKVIPTQS